MFEFRKIWRWSTAGLSSYFSWFVLNLLLLGLFPLFFLLRGLGARGVVRRVMTACLRAYFLHILPRFGLYRIDRRSDKAALGQIRQGLVVINHTSWLDALIVLSLVPKVRPLVSTRYAKVPLVSRAMGWLGCIFVDRRDRGSVAAAVEAIRQSLASGTPVAVFPEGTRSAIGHLGPFQEVFFSIAAEEGAVVEPVLLLFDIPFLGPGTENFLTPRPAILRILKLPTINPERREKGRDLAFRTRRVMRKEMRGAENAGSVKD